MWTTGVRAHQTPAVIGRQVGNRGRLFDHLKELVGEVYQTRIGTRDRFSFATED